jgi:glutathione S-transferase
MSETPKLVLYHHPYSRAAGVVWMFEELGLPYELKFVDVNQGEQSKPEFRKKNPMGKLPTLVDGTVTVTETSAIGMYLADRYSYGKLAPKIDDPARATYLRWIAFAPAVIEPGCYAHVSKWDYKPGQAGWGSYENMLASIEEAIGDGPWLLGENFSMADIIFGGTVRFMLRFKMLDPRDSFVAYAARLDARPGSIAAAARNDAVVEAQGLAKMGA